MGNRAWVLLLAVSACGRSFSPADSVAPVVALSGPCRDGVTSPCGENAIVSGDVTIEVDHTGGGPLTAVEFWTPGVQTTRVTAKPWSWKVATRGLFPVGGVMPVYVTPIGENGVRASPVQYSFVVDNSGPEGYVLSPPLGSQVPMGQPIAVTLCAHDQQGVGTVTASAGEASGELIAAGTCTDGSARYQGTVAAPAGTENTLPFQLFVDASDLRGNVSRQVVSLTATREQWSNYLRDTPYMFGTSVGEVRRAGFQAYQGGVAIETSTLHLFWLGADGGAETSRYFGDTFSNYAFGAFANGSVATIHTASPSSIEAVNASGPDAFENKDRDWGGIGSLIAPGEDTACFASDEANTNPLFVRFACFGSNGATRFFYTLDKMSNDFAFMGVAGSNVVTVLNAESSCSSGYKIQPFNLSGTALASSCISSRRSGIYAQADRFGAVIRDNVNSWVATVDPTTGAVNVLPPPQTRFALALGPGGRVLWFDQDAATLSTRIAVSQPGVNGGANLWQTEGEFSALFPTSLSPSIGGQMASFDTDGSVFAAFVEVYAGSYRSHVVSYDAQGNLRWHWVGPKVIALSLMPGTRDPVYVLHEDGTVRALVR